MSSDNQSKINDIDDNRGLYGSAELFTDLQSCTIPTETDSQSSYSLSSLSDDDDDDVQPIKIHFYSLANENTVKSNVDITENENHKQTIANLGSSSDILELIHTDLYKFIFEPISEQLSSFILCRVKRHWSGSSEVIHLEVECNKDGKSLCLLRADKQIKLNGQSHYEICVVSTFNNDFHSAELFSTTGSGMSYVLYLIKGDERQEMGNISYEANFLGLKGPRKIEVLLPKLNDSQESLIDENDAGMQQNNCSIRLHNKPPEWDPDSCCHTLKFNGIQRVLIPSIKNFQLLTRNRKGLETNVMEFGRMSDNEFSCDFRYPLSLIQAFSIALSALESRLLRG